jgi:hypothetical protein
VDFAEKGRFVVSLAKRRLIVTRERGTLHRGTWSAGAPPDYSIAEMAINQETKKWLGAGKWGF